MGVIRYPYKSYLCIFWHCHPYFILQFYSIVFFYTCIILKYLTLHIDTMAFKFTPLYTESSLTLDNLTSVLKDVLVPGHVAAWLAITCWDQESIIVNQDGSRARACWEFFLKNHPAPSWKVVAIALWRTADYRALETVMKLYFKCKLIFIITALALLIPYCTSLQLVGFTIITIIIMSLHAL